MARRVLIVGIVLVVMLTVFATAQESVAPNSPPHQHSRTAISGKQAAHRESVDQRGDLAMGFSHQKTGHHFRLTKNGGYIQVQANDANDTASVDQIHQHLTLYCHRLCPRRFFSSYVDPRPHSTRCTHNAASEILRQLYDCDHGPY